MLSLDQKKALECKAVNTELTTGEIKPHHLKEQRMEMHSSLRQQDHLLFLYILIRQSIGVFQEWAHHTHS